MSLAVKNLSVAYLDHEHSIQALDQVSLALTPGKITALVGESGSGKTTLGKACLGLLPENAGLSGEIRLDGAPIQDFSEAQFNQIRWQKAAMVFQNGAANLNPVQRVIDQVAEPVIQHRGLDKAQALMQAGRALGDMGLEPEQQTRFPHQLSGGQVQRALLAMALVLDPQVLILDEPTANLDAMSKAFVAQVIGRCKERGQAVLLITHDLELACHLADELAVLYLGQIMETMPAAELLTRPLHPYTLALGRSYPSLDTERDLGGIRGDAFYRVVHRHGGQDGHTGPHTHIQTKDGRHTDGHAPPAGCVFKDRCTQAIESCSMGEITLSQTGGHAVRCLRGGIVDLLQLKGLAKSYGKVMALRPTDLTLRAGEFFCLVGETGSGKTTLAMIAGGALEPDQGGRVFEGRDMDEWRKKDFRSLARRIGIIYQSPSESVSHRLNVAEVVAEPLKIHGAAGDAKAVRQRVREVLAQADLSTEPAFLGRYAHELNMGAIQRVCLARALILNPALLIADEPTSSLDPSVQAKVMRLLFNLQIERGLTMLFVTHNIGLARKTADRIGVMLRGLLVETGPAHLVFSAPLHPYTQSLIELARGLNPQAALNPAIAQGEPACPFAPRCPRAQEVCQNQEPFATEQDHRQVRCHFPLVYNELSRSELRGISGNQ